MILAVVVLQKMTFDCCLIEKGTSPGAINFIIHSAAMEYPSKGAIIK